MAEQFTLLHEEVDAEFDFKTSTSAMQIDGVGVVIKVSTEKSSQVAEALQFVAGVKIGGDEETGYKIVDMFK